MSTDVLTINGGSSTIKFALYAPGDPPRKLLSGKMERVGLRGRVCSLRRQRTQKSPTSQPIDASNHGHAVEGLIDWLALRVGISNWRRSATESCTAETRYTEARPITPEMVVDLKRLGSLDPDHIPEEVALIEAFVRRFPDLPQVACFDTAFHRDLPAGCPAAAGAAAVRGGGSEEVRVPRPVLCLPDGRTGAGRRAGGRARPRHPGPPGCGGEHGSRPRREVSRHDHGLHPDRRTGHVDAHRRPRPGSAGLPDA